MYMEYGKTTNGYTQMLQVNFKQSRGEWIRIMDMAG